MESKAPTNRHLLLPRLLLLLVLAFLPFTTVAETHENNAGLSDEHDGELTYPPDQSPTKKDVNVGVPSVKEKSVPHCTADFQCQCPPSACECPSTLEPEAFKLLKNNLEPVIYQRLMELQEKTCTGQTNNMLLKESNSEF